jgi:hypothetical protein
MKCHHPDVFLAAILNAQPMGFYAPAQLVRDAREHGVEVRPVDVNRSQWDCALEKTVTPYHAVRLGFCMVRSLKQKDGRGSCRSNGLHGRDDFFHVDRGEAMIGHNAPGRSRTSGRRRSRQATTLAMNTQRCKSKSGFLSNNDCRRMRGTGSETTPPAAR